MRFAIPGERRKAAPRPRPVGPGRLRKIAIIGGSVDSLRYAPWNDPTWEFWAHSSAALMTPYNRCDRLFDLHPEHCYTEQRKAGFKDYYAYLKGCPIPIYMQRVVDEIPQSVAYPREMMKMLWPGIPFGSQTAWMIALALYEGVTHLGFFGVNYAHETEYQDQRSNAERWVGIAEGQGVHIILPPTTPFCREPYEDYAYESHSTPEKYALIKAKFLVAKKAVLEKAAKVKGPLTPVTDDEAATALLKAKQPKWAEAVAKFGPDEEYPEALRKRDERERRHAGDAGIIVGPDGRPTRHQAPGHPGVGAVSRAVRQGSGAGPEAPAPGARQRVPGRTRPTGGSRSGGGDQPVQRALQPARQRRGTPVAVTVRHQPQSRTPVARARRPAGPRRPTPRKRR